MNTDTARAAPAHTVDPAIAKAFEREFIDRLIARGRGGLFGKISRIPHLEENVIGLSCSEGAEAAYIHRHLSLKVREAKLRRGRTDRVIVHLLSNHGGGCLLAPFDVVESMLGAAAVPLFQTEHDYWFGKFKEAIAMKYAPTIALVGHGGDTSCGMATRVLGMPIDAQLLLLVEAVRHVDRSLNGWLAACRAAPDQHPCSEVGHAGHSWVEHFPHERLNVVAPFHTNRHDIRRLWDLQVHDYLNIQETLADLCGRRTET